MFQYICIIFRESFVTLAKITKIINIFKLNNFYNFSIVDG